MNDPMQLLRAANPVTECEPPDFARLLARLDEGVDDGTNRPRSEIPTRWGRFVRLRRTNLPHPGSTGRAVRGLGSLTVVMPVLVAVSVAVVALVSLHGSGTHGPGPTNANGGGPAQTTSSSGSMAYSPGQARGRVVIGSMHPFGIAASGAPGETWGAEWFRTTSSQICVQAGREVSGRLGYVDIDGVFPHDGRFRPWAANTAVNARCIAQPAHGGVALMVAERVADSGYRLTAGAACTAAQHGPCPKRDTTTLFYGVLGSSAGMAAYGSGGHSEQAQSSGPDGDYIAALWGGNRMTCQSTGPCPSTAPDKLVHPGSRAFVIYDGAGRVCRLSGPGTHGLMAGDCPYGLTLGPSPARLTEADVRTPVQVITRAVGNRVRVTTRLRTRVASSQIAGYGLRLSTPGYNPRLKAPGRGCSLPGGGTVATLIGIGTRFRAGQILTETTALARCPGTYRGAVIAHPLVGSPLIVARFRFRAPHR